jgi:hypothetical protein
VADSVVVHHLADDEAVSPVDDEVEVVDEVAGKKLDF